LSNTQTNAGAPTAPGHIAIIMDGNGRWAKKRRLPRAEGHRRGVEALAEVVSECLKLGVGYLTVFAFSTENWNRPKDEIDKLLEIFRSHLQKHSGDYRSRNVRLLVLGDIAPFPEDLRQACEKAQRETKDCTALTLSIALGYGSRAELLRAAQAIAREGKGFTEENLRANLYTSGLPDPDLVIRTSGERRLSNFLLFQCAYSELYFTDVLWPDFDGKQLRIAIDDYKGRQRRYGAL